MTGMVISRWHPSHPSHRWHPGHPRHRWVALAALGVLMSAACGQYPGAHRAGIDARAQGGLGSLEGQSLDGTADGGFGTSGTSGTEAGTGGTTSAGGPSTSAGNATGPSGPANLLGHTTTGVTEKLVTIGIHAPITGAAPVTDESFDEGKDLYWKYGNDGKPFFIYGRTVTVLVENDQYNPTQATLVCKKMVEQNHAFLLIGGAGTDQIVACAKYSTTQPGPVPYLSAGVTQEPLEGLGNSFALSMSYPQQVPLLVDYIKTKLGATRANRVAIVATNTANFDDAVEAWDREFPGTDHYRPNKSDESAPATTGQQLCLGPRARYDAVFPLVAPLFFLQMAQAATCKPTFAGVGITMGIDAVADATCKLGYRSGSSHFFSPAPGFRDVGSKDPQFSNAAKAKGVDPDDIMWLLWGTMGGIHQLLVKAGADLSRERFIQTTSNANVDGQGVFPDLRYSPSNHFGATSVNVLKLNCTPSEGYWLTEARNVTGF